MTGSSGGAGAATAARDGRGHAGRRPPGPGRAETPRVLAALARDPLAAGLGLYRRYGDLVRVPLLRGDRALFVLSHPDHAEHVFVTRHADYPKSVTYRPLREFLGDGLVTSEGALWERQRRLIQPLFSHRRVAAFHPVMVRNVRRMLDDWDRRAPGDVVDVSEAMSLLTLNIVGEALFGADLRGPGARVSPSVTAMQDFAVTAMRNPLLLRAPRLGLRTTPGYRKWAAAVRAVDEVVATVIAARRAGGTRDSAGPDLLDALLDARHEDGTALGDRQLRDEIVTFLMAGHETSATALVWALYLLATHPAARQRLEEEVDTVLAGRDPGPEDLDGLVWTKAVLCEALRLYPPFWTLERDALRDDEIDGVRVPAGSTVAVPPYLVHRHPDFWENPEGFDPGRFLPGRGAGRHRHAFIPFGGGRRGCVGNAFAMTETVVVIAMLAQGRRLDVPSGGVPAVQPTVTLRPRGGLHMVLRRR
ncbi:cytochrome P450 [Streptomyces sp. JJ36]|uniref:cytochrome P450 n=1 Tax=Streptomyces sp. JJ36 TaxID=2736645 RepID=UPI001F254046|nr:cytochrome P450 [Streptomyces sp. JJ36]MCF6524480.1 cytochrome P450 [Streptomyces sp. JJ36]